MKHLKPDSATLRDCADDLYEALIKMDRVLTDIMPQIGRIVIQDYGNLNDALVETSRVLLRLHHPLPESSHIPDWDN